MKDLNLLVGSDPELMCFSPDNKLTSAIAILPENGKNKKMVIGDGCIFYDNVQLEVNVKPAQTADELIKNFRNLFYKIKTYIYPYTFRPQASATFPNDQLEHPDAKVFGCEPEWDCYTLEVVKPPTSTDGFRSAGGHIHLGQPAGASPLNLPFGEDNDTTDRDWGKISVVRMMDLIVGVPSVILDKDPTSRARRKLYGSPGSNRPKEYGVEYRSIGNFWLETPSRVSLIFSLSYQAVVSVLEGYYSKLWPVATDISKCKYPVAEVCRIIKDSDVEAAKKFTDKYIKPIIPRSLYLELLSAASENKKTNFYNAWEI